MNEAKKVFNELVNDSENESLIHSALSANIYLTKIDFIENNPDKALPRIKASLEISERRKEIAFIPEFEMLYGNYSMLKDKYPEAKEYFEKASCHFEKLGSTDKVNQISIQLNQAKNKS